MVYFPFFSYLQFTSCHSEKKICYFPLWKKEIKCNSNFIRFKQHKPGNADITYLIAVLTWAHYKEKLYLSKPNLNTPFVQNWVISQNMNICIGRSLIYFKFYLADIFHVPISPNNRNSITKTCYLE